MVKHGEDCFRETAIAWVFMVGLLQLFDIAKKKRIKLRLHYFNVACRSAKGYALGDKMAKKDPCGGTAVATTFFVTFREAPLQASVTVALSLRNPASANPTVKSA